MDLMQIAIIYNFIIQLIVVSQYGVTLYLLDMNTTINGVKRAMNRVFFGEFLYHFYHLAALFILFFLHDQIVTDSTVYLVIFSALMLSSLIRTGIVLANSILFFSIQKYIKERIRGGPN